MELSGQLHTSADLNRWVGPGARLVGKQNTKMSYPLPAINVTYCQPHGDVMHAGRNKKIYRTVWINRVSGVWRVWGAGREAAGKLLTLGLLTAYEMHSGMVFSTILLCGIE